jgi:hypothetical protein
MTTRQPKLRFSMIGNSMMIFSTIDHQMTILLSWRWSSTSDRHPRLILLKHGVSENSVLIDVPMLLMKEGKLTCFIPIV